MTRRAASAPQAQPRARSCSGEAAGLAGNRSEDAGPDGPAQTPKLPISPGTYLRRRREAAGKSHGEVALALAALPWAVRPPEQRDVDLLIGGIEEAEADRDNLTVPQALLLRNVYAFDVDVYEELLLIHHAGPGSCLAVPQLCRVCACSWMDACVVSPAHVEPVEVCEWVEFDLCSACAPVGAGAPAMPQFAPGAGTERVLAPAGAAS